jgi:hypothetical protein
MINFRVPDHTDLRIPAFLLRGSPDRDLSFVGTDATDEAITSRLPVNCPKSSTTNHENESERQEEGRAI